MLFVRYLKKELIMFRYAYNEKEVKFLRQVLTPNSRYSLNKKKLIKV